MMPIEQALKRPDGFSQVEAYGSFDPERHILLDNRIFNGRAGVEAFTPFYLEAGGVVLVNRGWLPMAPDRRKLPGVPTDPAARTITGLLKKPVEAGYRLGQPDIFRPGQWPQLVTYLDVSAIGTALETNLPDWILLLDPQDPSGFEDRQWQPAVMTPEVHRAYAIQWFALALATLIIWLTLGFRRGQLKHRAPDGPA